MIRWLNMTNTGKVLIIGLLVIDVGVAGYLLFPKDDERPPTVSGTVIGSDGATATGDSRAPETSVAAGSVARTMPGDGATDTLAEVPPAAPVVKVAPASPASTATTVAPVVNAANTMNATPAAPAVTAAPAASRATGQAANGSRPATSTAIASTAVRRPAQSKSKPALHAEQVRGRKQDKPHRGGSNQVSAALTAQLVKESAKPDPSLPMPPSSSSSKSTHRSSNPVASAMTDQLVRESSRVNLSEPAQAYKH
jgi:hypothetical protein